jgi:zinc transporter, ZIP family
MPTSDASDENPNVGVAMGLVAGAGAATALGAAVVFVPSWVQYANRTTLASALGLSAGVMVYVSFVEIFRKSVTAFANDGFSADDAYVYATLCFFSGVVFMVVSRKKQILHSSLKSRLQDQDSEKIAQ